MTPALILIYGTIDILASLDRDESHHDVERSDFKKWVDEYLLPGAQLPCTANDLYAARCGLLHTYSPESSMSRKGEAVPIFYAWGDARARDLRELVDSAGYRATAIHVDTLCDALNTAIERFISGLANDSEHRELVRQRMNKLFVNMPTDAGAR